MREYEIMVITKPDLPESDLAKTVDRWENIMKTGGGEILKKDNWGAKRLAYPIQKKTTGFYHLLEFQADGDFVSKMEVAFKRDERIIRFLTVALDKHSTAYNEKRRTKGFDKPKTETPVEA
jgi:small subunit ribosomal protein S6